jgi:hypothetical protein
MIGVVFSPILAQQQFEDLDYKIRGGTVLDFEIDSETSSLILSLDARARGELIITLPRYLIDAKIGSEDSDFDIFVSGLKLFSYDETITPFDRTVTIPFKRGNSEIIITGTHVYSKPPVALSIQTQSIDQMIQSELRTEIPDGQAKLLIFSDTDWSGALQSSSFDYTEIDGKNNDSIIFGCESSFGRQGVFGAKIEKLTQDGFLKIVVIAKIEKLTQDGFLKIVVIQNQKILSQGSTEVEFGDVLINGNCTSGFGSGSEGGGCLIATATYGSELAPQVQQLRELRDNYLLQTDSGTFFIKSFNDFYYSFSPVIADYERENLVFKEIVKIAITPMISSLSILNYVDMNSEIEVLGYGISLILLNGMMYLGIPAIAIIGIRKNL